MITEKEMEEAKELWKEGYIHLTLWRRLLLVEKHYLIGEEYKCRQAIRNLESDI